MDIYYLDKTVMVDSILLLVRGGLGSPPGLAGVGFVLLADAALGSSPGLASGHVRRLLHLLLVFFLLLDGGHVVPPLLSQTQ